MLKHLLTISDGLTKVSIVFYERLTNLLRYIVTVKSSIQLVEQLAGENTSLYKLIEMFRISIPPTDLALYQTLDPTLRSLKDTLDIAIDTKEEKITKFTMDLEKNVSELMQEVLEIRNKAQDPMVLNPTSNHELVVAFLEDLVAQLNRAEAQKKRYEVWSELFKTGGEPSGETKEQSGDSNSSNTQAKQGELEETKVEVELKRTLWSSLHQWEHLTQ